ncbi:MAG: histidinol-phosphate transaminase [Firmicutes bacterium]|nr:histidinol-phosphate transaminase [Bacillota bacterium]
MSALPPVRRSVLRMAAYQPPLGNRRGALRLDFNENTVGCSRRALDALRRLTQEEAAVYPEYERIQQRLARGFGVPAGQLLLTAGTDDALRLAVDTVVEPGSLVVLVEPTFAMYRFYAERAGARLLVLRYGAQMQFPEPSVLRALAQRPRLFVLANPNNPTGTLVPLAVLRRILQAAPRTWVLVDEAYSEFSDVTVLPWVRRYPQLLVTRTFSKAFGLAGLRVGCLFAHRRAAPLFRRAQSPYPVATPALVAAEQALRDRRFLREYLRAVRTGKQILVAGLERLRIPQFPSAANFVLVDFGRRAEAVLRALRRQGILLRDRRSDFGRVGYVRITVGTPAQTRRLVRALEALW